MTRSILTQLNIVEIDMNKRFGKTYKTDFKIDEVAFLTNVAERNLGLIMRDLLLTIIQTNLELSFWEMSELIERSLDDEININESISLDTPLISLNILSKQFDNMNIFEISPTDIWDYDSGIPDTFSKKYYQHMLDEQLTILRERISLKNSNDVIDIETVFNEAVDNVNYPVMVELLYEKILEENDYDFEILERILLNDILLGYGRPKYIMDINEPIASLKTINDDLYVVESNISVIRLDANDILSMFRNMVNHEIELNGKDDLSNLGFDKDGEYINWKKYIVDRIMGLINCLDWECKGMTDLQNESAMERMVKIWHLLIVHSIIEHEIEIEDLSFEYLNMANAYVESEPITFENIHDETNWLLENLLLKINNDVDFVIDNFFSYLKGCSYMDIHDLNKLFFK